MGHSSNGQHFSPTDFPVILWTPGKGRANCSCIIRPQQAWDKRTVLSKGANSQIRQRKHGVEWKRAEITFAWCSERC